MIQYKVPDGVQQVMENVSPRPILTTVQNGKVAVDHALLKIWKFADGRTLEDLEAAAHKFELKPEFMRAAVACLAEAGLLKREGEEIVPRALKPVVGKKVSAVILGYCGKDWLEACIPSLLAQNYSPVEIIVVDNASPEPLAAWLNEKFPQVKVVTLKEPQNISAANNRGVEAAEGEYYLLLNQDTHLEPDAIAEMVKRMEADSQCVCVLPKLRLYWAPAFLNGIGNRAQINFWGTDNAIGYLDLGQFDHWEEVPSVCTAGALFSKKGWETVGPMDEGFLMYYDDTEWGYRARLQGLKVKTAPKSIVYHAFGGRIPTGLSEELAPRKLRNVVYGRYRFVLKLLFGYRKKLLLNYFKEDYLNVGKAILTRRWSTAQAYLDAWGKVAKDLPSIRELHRTIEPRRVITDEQLFALQQNFPDLATWNNLPDLNIERVILQYYPVMASKTTRPIPEMEELTKKNSRRLKLLIVSNDVVSEKMGGPGARYLEIAKVLSRDIDVTLAVPNETDLTVPDVNILQYREDVPSSLEVLVENNDIAIISGYMSVKFPYLFTTSTRLVVDLYDPFFLENIYYYLNEPIHKQIELNGSAIDVVNRLIHIGDFFICGTEVQRDFWLGMLAASARINPLTFKQDPTLRSLIDVVGIGYPSRNLKKKNVVRGSLVPMNAKIVVWGGGIWNWLDPLTLVKAWPQVVAKHPDAHLVFLGTRYPNPLVPEHKMARDTINLAEEIGEKDRSIHFIEWVSYDDHQALLRESDIGVTFQPDHIETHFSIRTRVIDYFSADLPTLVSEGDITAAWVRQYCLGRVIPTNDVHAMADSLNEMLCNPREIYQEAFARVRQDFDWSNVVEPLRNYCLNGTQAPDRLRVPRAAVPVMNFDTRSMQPSRRNRVKQVIEIVKTEGIPTLARKSVRHLIWLITRK